MGWTSRRVRTALWAVELSAVLWYGLQLGASATEGRPALFDAEAPPPASTTLCPAGVVVGSGAGVGPGRHAYVPTVDASGNECWVLHDGGAVSP
jgi:hypothetical protein